MFCLLTSTVALGQSPFVNFYWEANDGSGWARSELTTSRQLVQIRLAAEWGAPNGTALVGTGFDAVISTADDGDLATNLLRPDPFGFPVMTPAVIRQGNTIKLDDARDLEAPGEGTYWVQVAQAGPLFGGIVDTSNPAIIFHFDLQLADIQGTRRVHSIHRVRNSFNANIWTVGASTVQVLAPIYGIDVIYVPVPGGVALFAGIALLARRRR